MTVMQEEEQEAIEPPRYECGHCAREVPQVTGVDHGHRELCGACSDSWVRSCDRCGSTVDTYVNSLYEIRDPRDSWSGEEVCSDCRYDLAYFCEPCDCYHFDTVDCYADSGELDGLDDYSYKPEPRFHGTSAEFEYFGAEIEMESENGRGQDALDNFRDTFTGAEFYYKGDGSIYSEDGFEMVSHPRTLDSWQSILPRLQDSMQYARQVGMRSWNTSTCGIHVHIDTRAFGDGTAHLYRFTQFIYRNSAQMARLAGRGDVEYAHYFTPDSRKTYLANDIKHRRLTGRAGERYMAVNLQNHKTVEVRMFRGSLKPERLLANIEFLHALLNYTRTMTTRQAFAGALKFDVFAHYALMRGDIYPNLAALLADKFDMASA